MQSSKSSTFSIISVGIMVAATGVGAGDIAMAAYAGSKLGIIILWAAIVGGVLKYVLNEGLAKWHVATGTTLLQGWIQYLPKGISIYFGGYLILWTFLVAGTLMSFTGLVTNTLFPLGIGKQYATAIYGGLHSLVSVFLIYIGGFQLVEKLMRFLIGLMFTVVLISAIMVCPSWPEVIYSMFIPRLPTDSDSILLIFALIGGVGGSLTILCYSYWLNEQKRKTLKLRAVRMDLGIAYFLTALFGIAVIIIAAGVNPDDVKGYGLVLSISERLGKILGIYGKYAFMIGFWGAIFSSMLGVWNGVPYLFADFMQQYQNRTKPVKVQTAISTKSKYYRYFLLYIAIPPILLTIFERPYWIAIAYAIAGAFFMPFLASLLLYMNNRKDWVKNYKNNWLTNLFLLINLLLFLILFAIEIKSRIL